MYKIKMHGFTIKTARTIEKVADEAIKWATQKPDGEPILSTFIGDYARLEDHCDNLTTELNRRPTRDEREELERQIVTGLKSFFNSMRVLE